MRAIAYTEYSEFFRTVLGSVQLHTHFQQTKVVKFI